jgi:HPt (histidine-containing phosphotransfer) domain-containing protein
MDDILLKPFKRPDIQAMLNKWIHGRAAAETAGLPAPAQNTPADAIFSATELLDTFMNNKELACSLLERFMERTSGQIESLPALQALSDWETARREAHTIKGAALTLSGRELGKAAARLEIAFKNADLSEIEAASPQVTEAFARFKEDAGKFLLSRSAEPKEA